MADWKDDLRETNKLIREVILPQLIKIEIELNALRKHTWPYVQGKKEMGQLDDMEAKKDFFKHLDAETTIELIRRKARLSKNVGLQEREYDIIQSHQNNFC
jgi:hypothetical protein